MKRLQYILALTIILATSIAVSAQKGQLSGGINFNYSLPMGSFKNDIISKNSARGFNGELMYNINNKWSAGLNFGYQDYNQKYPRSVYNLDKNQQISAVLTNSLEAIPVMAKGNFSPVTTGFIRPYISLAAGAYFTNFNQYLGQYSGGSYNNASFIAQGGAGLLLALNKSGTTGLQLGAAYNYVPYNKNGYNNLNSLNIQAGIHFALK